MAYQDTFEIKNIPVTCTVDGDHDWLTTDFKIKAYANASNTAYTVEVYAKITSTSDINWSGAGDIRVTCNGVKASRQVSLALYKPGTTKWDGPAVFEFGAPGIVSLNMDFDLDLTRTTGFSGRPGIDHNKDGGSMQHFYYNGYKITIGDGGIPPLATNPVVSLTYASNTMESLVFNWKSDISLASCEYKVGSGSWVNLGVTGTSGSFTVGELTPGTSYTVYFRGKSGASYGSLSSNEVNANGSTIDIARITSIGECIFGNSITIVAKKPATNTATLKIWTTGNSRTPEFTMQILDGSNTFTPTQEQLDQIYKCFSNTNSIPIYFSLTTTGNWKNWSDTQQQKSLELTGIVKTAYVSVNNNPKRAQAFLGINNTPKRAIFWIGDENNKPRRCT